MTTKSFLGNQSAAEMNQRAKPFLKDSIQYIVLPKITSGKKTTKNTLIYLFFFRCRYFGCDLTKKCHCFSFTGKRQNMKEREPSDSSAVFCSRARCQWLLYGTPPGVRQVFFLDLTAVFHGKKPLNPPEVMTFPFVAAC